MGDSDWFVHSFLIFWTWFRFKFPFQRITLNSVFWKSNIETLPQWLDWQLFTKWMISKLITYIVLGSPQHFSNQLCRTLMSCWCNMDLLLSIKQKWQDLSFCLQWVQAFFLIINKLKYFYSKIFNHLIPLFGSAFRILPDPIIKGHLTTKSRMMWNFEIVGCIAVLFIEVGLATSSHTEHLNAIAQVIAECNG